MSSLQAVRFVAASAKSALGCVYLQCHVKPGTSKQREGIVAVSENVIDICVAAQAREGEANKAVRNLISDVLKVRRTDVEVIKGHKSRDKTITVSGIDLTENQQACILSVTQKLQDSVLS